MKDRRKAIGAYGEDLACKFLQKRGYKIIDRNVKFSYLEIDIVSRKKKTTSFIEVKTRTVSSLGAADQALRSAQIKKLKRAMVAYSIQNGIKLNTIQLDFVSVDIDREKKTARIKHYPDIF